ncbi:MAG: hypothetical protein VB858_03830 [Planctomycetaceae bacterium]
MTKQMPPEPDSAAQLFSSQVSILQAALPGFLTDQRWFAGKTQTIACVTVADAIALGTGCRADEYWLLLAEVLLSDQTRQQYSIPLVIERQQDSDNSAVLLHFRPTGSTATTCYVADATGRPDFWRCFVRYACIADSLRSHQNRQLKYVPTGRGTAWADGPLDDLSVELCESSQSNTTVFLGGHACLKLFRRPSVEINPDVEIGVFLTTRTHFTNSPAVTGQIQLVPQDGPAVCLAMISELVPALSDAWNFTRSQVDSFWQQLFISQKLLEASPDPVEWTIAACGGPLPADAQLLGDFPEAVALLGRRTAELHIALDSDSLSEAFCPEQESLTSVQEHLLRIRGEVATTVALLQSATLADPTAADLATRISAVASSRLDDLESAVESLTGRLMRVHGDYHLGQILRTDGDFMIIDFEGEPDRTPAERRRKCSVMKDVAGLIRSLHYAACAGAADLIPCLDDREIPGNVMHWQNFWFHCAAHSFLKGYLETADGHGFLPASMDQTQQLLELHLLEKVLYELRYELNNRPDWWRSHLPASNPC